MPMDKDYVLSLNRGLFNTFQAKYVRDAFDQIKEAVKDAETLPKSNVGLAKFAEKVVGDAFNEKFRLLLIKQVIRSIKNAPPNKVQKGVWNFDED
jgi:hypothetical protein